MRPTPQQELKVCCLVSPATVPLLARLPRLRQLHLEVPQGAYGWWDSSFAVASALLPVLLDAPRLQRASVSVGRTLGSRWRISLGAAAMLAALAGSGNREEIESPRRTEQELEAALQGGVEWMQRELRRLGRDPEAVAFMQERGYSRGAPPL